MKILIVDDEEKILEIIDAYLVANHYSVYKAISGAMALEKFEKNNPDLVVLDLMLPDTDGLTVCRKIREVSNVPIIMLTAKSDEDDILTGLKLGADDYMIKPFSPKELVARIQTVLRRTETLSNPNKLSSSNGELIVYPESRQVYLHQVELNLTTTEFDILHALISTPNKVFSLDLSQYLGHILVETVKPFFLLLILQIPVGLDSESSYGFDFGYKILQCS
ncbi:response regulator transcription factor [Enterococcus faecium]|uniref:response regulator transcription factor n=1 Tax=Enterococcus faecium TaxID=1352 RepID=UPI002A36C874|nr:response regulator transcription factor [Enterococcus faecium]